MSKSIPKIIHYCWFGHNPLPPSVEKCIESWKKNCPDYEIICWNEDNFDVSCCDYVREAYAAQKWAFVSDVARLMIIYEHGGIYLDTDVELIKSLDFVVDENEFFFGIETQSRDVSSIVSEVNTGIGFGAISHNNIVKDMLNMYSDLHFKTSDGIDLTPCPKRNSLALDKYGFDGRDDKYIFMNGTIYPSEYFCPLEYKSDVTHFSKNTISIHHFDSSWHTSEEKYFDKLMNKFCKIFPEYLSYQLSSLMTAVKFNGLIKGVKIRLEKLLDKTRNKKDDNI